MTEGLFQTIRTFSRRVWLWPVLGGIAALCAGGCRSTTETASVPALPQVVSPATAAETRAEDPVKRGEYLVAIGACNDCHTPFKNGPNGPEPDMSRMLSGHPADLTMPAPPPLGEGPWLWVGAATNTAFAGPWGVTYAVNLTPEENTGLGIWTEEMFVKAIKTGKHMGQSRPIMPPMPWPQYSRMTDDDLKAIYAYLRSIPAIENQAPAYAPPSGAEQ